MKNYKILTNFFTAIIFSFRKHFLDGDKLKKNARSTENWIELGVHHSSTSGRLLHPWGPLHSRISRREAIPRKLDWKNRVESLPLLPAIVWDGREGAMLHPRLCMEFGWYWDHSRRVSEKKSYGTFLCKFINRDCPWSTSVPTASTVS